MPNPTVQAVIDAARGLLNEPGTGFWNDTIPELIRWVSQGQVSQHNDVMKALAKAGKAQDISHNYLKNFVKVQSANTVVGQSDYALPADHGDTLFVRYGSPLRVAERQDMRVDAMSQYSGFFGAQPDRALWAQYAGNNIRLYVVPGVNGVPQTVTPYEVWYVKVPTQLTALADTLDVPDLYTDGILYYVLANCQLKLLKSPDSFLAMRKMAVEQIA